MQCRCGKERIKRRKSKEMKRQTERSSRREAKVSLKFFSHTKNLTGSEVTNCIVVLTNSQTDRKLECTLVPPHASSLHRSKVRVS